MELWIRSQDKTRLIKSEGLFLFSPCLESLECEICSGIDGAIAKYKTKERALEVLDEIQKLIQPTFHYEPIVREKYNEESMTLPYIEHEQIGSKTEIIQFQTYVYEMPKE